MVHLEPISRGSVGLQENKHLNNYIFEIKWGEATPLLTLWWLWYSSVYDSLLVRTAVKQIVSPE